MQNIEIIRICAFNEASREQAIIKAREISHTCCHGGEGIAIWTSTDQNTDMLILLKRKGDIPVTSYSMEGLQIADYFSRFGWISHSLWQDLPHEKKNSG
ncbi:hypothetical protein OOT00_08090 [Desulfobotulus sp. H1]|uniref:DUF3303 domain-containing protein n=1 Tax=Desulfobotulus pelophilus TaxID=2823377 RepID=A0ABT3N907_9BACT|nr:hypothetical protein [Desulfobotulus pelophilus]MCW7753943.1 hypothetical protein [Desulfobotulus pelophilus]